MQNRIDRLQAALNARVQEKGGRILLLDEEMRTFADIACRSYSGTQALPEIQRKARFLSDFADHWPCVIPEDELIVGSQAFGMVHHWQEFLDPRQREAMRFRGNLGHIIVDYGRVVSTGVQGLRQRIEAGPAGQKTAAFLAAADAFSHFIRRHGQAAFRQAEFTAHSQRARELQQIGENCEWISTQPPLTFWQGLQLVWFIQVFLHAEGGAAAVSFGRFDQYLWPLLEADLHNKRVTMDFAEELLSCFWLKCCEGDESQNLTLGGVTPDGDSGENPLSLLCLKVARTLKTWQPSVSVRIHDTTSESFWRQATELCQCGIGQPSFFNDPIVVRALRNVDIPEDRAADWGIVGCYEATPQGDTCGLTVAGQWNLADVLLDFLTEDRRECDFAAFTANLKSYYASRFQKQLAAFQERWSALRADCPSPFESICLTGCIESGLAAEEGGGRYNLFGVNLLGLGTLIDSLVVIHDLIFGQGLLSFDALRAQLKDDFSDSVLRARCGNLPGRFGTDTDLSNSLARDWSSFLSDLVLAGRIHGPNGIIRPYPAFFWFGGDIHNQTAATPDGRRANDPLSYGCGPSSSSKNLTPVAILNSASHVAHDRCACGNPLLISLSQTEAAGEAGHQLIQQLIKGYFRRGGFHMHFNLVDAEQLREARKHPDRHPDLMVRISGFSASFHAIDPRWQEAIIERTERGM